MKKRINSSEIERARRSNRFLFILTILMLLVVIGGLVFYVLYDKKLISFGNENSHNEESIISKNETKFDVKESNTEALRLYNIVRVTNNECSEYINAKGIKVKELSDNCKFSIASNIYNRYLDGDVNNKYVLEEDVIYAYESLFGEGSYKSQETIPYMKGTNLYYSEVNNKYFVQGEVQDMDSNMNGYEDIISIKKDNNYLYINSAIMYYESINKNICKDYDCNEVVEKISEEPSPDYYSLYIKHNKNKLYNYQYKFRLDKNGFYKYLGYEKTIK